MYPDEVMAKAIPPFPLETRYPVRRQAITNSLKRAGKPVGPSRGISLNECQVWDVCNLHSAHIICLSSGREDQPQQTDSK